MKGLFVCTMLTYFVPTLAISQDIITLNKGEVIHSKVIEIGPTEIKYKRYDNQEGPVYVVQKSDISNIIYENGAKDTFETQTANIVANNDMAPQIAETPIDNTKASTFTTTGKKFLTGFAFVLPSGIWPETALSNMGTTAFLKGQGHPVKSFGMGILMQYKVTKSFNLFLDGNFYNYNILVGEQGSDVQTVWTVEQSATHWDEPDAPQIQYVHNLPTDVHFDMQSTGFRLGGKYSFLNKKVRPWIGAGFGFYTWFANYYNAEKDQTYGKDNGIATGFSLLAGIDFEPMANIIITPFIDLGSPVANYQMEGLFYPQWDIDYNSHIFGTTRFGISITF